MIRLALADDDPLILKHLSRALTAFEDISVVAAVLDGETLLEVLRTTPVDIALVDVEMPVLNGISTTRRIKEDFPNIPVIILTTFEKEDRLGQALCGGSCRIPHERYFPRRIASTHQGRAGRQNSHGLTSHQHPSQYLP